LSDKETYYLKLIEDNKRKYEMDSRKEIEIANLKNEINSINIKN